MFRSRIDIGARIDQHKNIELRRKHRRDAGPADSRQGPQFNGAGGYGGSGVSGTHHCICLAEFHQIDGDFHENQILRALAAVCKMKNQPRAESATVSMPRGHDSPRARMASPVANSEVQPALKQAAQFEIATTYLLSSVNTCR